MEQASKIRCFGEGKPFYELYHDEEWGVPVHEDQKLFELLILEGAQAGLSWEQILKRRNDYRRLFHDFDPQLVAKMKDSELEEILQDPSIVRNRRKIFAVKQNALVFLEIQKEKGSFDAYVWSFVNGQPLVNHWRTHRQVPCESEVSLALAKDLKKRGMTFVGTKIIYSFMQAVGMIDDHLLSCWKRQA